MAGIGHYQWEEAVRIKLVAEIRFIILDDEIDSYEKAVKIEDLMYEYGFMGEEE